MEPEMPNYRGANAPEPPVLIVDKAIEESPIELAATIATLIIHPDIALSPRLVALMVSAGLKIGRALGMAGLPPEFRDAIETRMMLGAAASHFAIADSYASTSLVPVYAEYPFEQIVERYDRIEKVWRERLAAGEVFRLLAEATRAGDGYVLPPGVKRPSVEQLSAAVMPEIGITETKNFTERVWRRSWPVAHLAAAIRSVDDQAQASWGHQVLPPNLIFSPALLPVVLRRADGLARVMDGAKLRGNRGACDLLRLKIAA